MVSGLKTYIRLIEALGLLDAGIAAIVGSFSLSGVLDPPPFQRLNSPSSGPWC